MTQKRIVDSRSLGGGVLDPGVEALALLKRMRSYIIGADSQPATPEEERAASRAWHAEIRKIPPFEEMAEVAERDPG